MHDWDHELSKSSILISGSCVDGGLASSLAKGFSEAGWAVHHFDDEASTQNFSKDFIGRCLNRFFWKIRASKVQKLFISNALKIKPDVLFILKGFYYDIKTLKMIRQKLPHVKLVHFNPDNSFNTWHFGNSNAWIRKSIPYYDIHLTWGKFLISPLRRAGAQKIIYFPFGFDPSLHHPVLELSLEEKKKYSSDISFVGSWDEEREYWLSHLLDYNIKIWGNGWDRAADSIQAKWQKSEITGKNFSTVCCASKINLNFIRRQNLPAHNMRTFEIPASGGFMLSTRTEEQSQLFSEGSEIACFSTPQELREKLDFYLRYAEVRVAMAKCAYDRVSRGSSYNHRVVQMESIMS